MSPDTVVYTYQPDVFACSTLEAAKAIILVPEDGKPTEQRWKEETLWLKQFLQFDTDLPVLDYGCGVGRIARVLNRPVLGVDISPTMRAHADFYVNREDFMAVPRSGLRILVQAGLRCGGAICSWVLQHSPEPQKDIDLIASALVSGAPLWLLNRFNRAVPAQSPSGVREWVHDDVDIFPMLESQFQLTQEITPPPDVIMPGATLRRYLRRG